MSPRMTRLLWRFADLTVAAFTGGPIRAVAIGGALIVLAVRFVGWWLPLLVIGLAIAVLVWCALQLPKRWRPW